MWQQTATLVLLVVGAHACPAPCRCYVGDVDCSEKDLTTLQTDMFNWTGAEHLPELNLQGNAIVSLPPHIFDALWGLKTLNLNHNQLRVLDVDVFSNLKALKFLDMKENQLTVLPIGLFESQNKLIALDLRKNLLRTLDVKVLMPLWSLSTLAMKGNPLECNCSLQPAVIWSIHHSEGSDAECRFPPSFSGKHWAVLEKMSCEISTSTTLNPTTITDQPTTTTIYQSTVTIPQSTHTTEVPTTSEKSTPSPEELTEEISEIRDPKLFTRTILIIITCLSSVLVLLIIALVIRIKHDRRPKVGSDPCPYQHKKDPELLYDDAHPYDVIHEDSCSIPEPGSDAVRYVTMKSSFDKSKLVCNQ